MSTDLTLPSSSPYLKSSPWPTKDGRKIHWSELFEVHPSAAVFPMMSEDEIKALAKDIKENGMHQPPVFWKSPKGPSYLIDGRNRLEAAMQIDNVNLQWLKRDDGWLLMTKMLEEGIDPVAYIIGINVKRRHLTKKQQADLIVRARKAETTVAEKRSVGGSPKGKRGGGGSTKDPVKEKVVKDCVASGISEGTAQQAWDDAKIDLPKIGRSKKASSKAKPPSAPITPQNIKLKLFDKAVKWLRLLVTKLPPTQFAGTTHSVEDLEKVDAFIRDVIQSLRPS